MKKRGSKRSAEITIEMFFTIFQIILALGIFIATQTYIHSSINETLFHKKYMVRDLALTINTLNMPSGDVSYVYSNDEIGFENFIFSFNDGEASVVEKSEKAIPSKYPYAFNRNLDFKNVRFFGKNSIFLNKKKEGFEIKDE